MLVLVINSGSSSLKYQVRDTENSEVLTSGVIERIGFGAEGSPADHSEALDLVDADIAQVLGDRQIDAVGHRVVHGGERFSEPVLITAEVTEAIERLNPLAPLHNPPAVLGIKALLQKWPGTPQVAVFDTAFHRTMPEEAWRYAIPNELYTDHGIRRYGFHGTSHEYVAEAAAQLLGVPADQFTGVIAHLGNGASVTAVKDGQSIDTSMGFTPLEGLVMGTRSGDVDPSIPLFLLRHGYSIDEADAVLNRQSGLLALGGSNDARTIEDAAEAGDERAQLAMDSASYRLAKYIGAYHVAVGGAKALVFTAGIGENSSNFRAAVLKRLDALGIRVDLEAQDHRVKSPEIISSPDSAIAVLVIPTNEEAAIAEATRAIVSAL